MLESDTKFQLILQLISHHYRLWLQTAVVDLKEEQSFLAETSEKIHTGLISVLKMLRYSQLPSSLASDRDWKWGTS